VDIASETTILRGTKTSVGGRRLKADLDARFCAEHGCPTRLSRYNMRPRCYAHRATRFPRTRGQAVG
jgi:NADH pyrophosphatase NudC (nudix superfamily)